MLLTKIDFDLSESTFQFNEKGEMVDATKIVFRAPSMQDIKITTKLKQLISKGTMDAMKILGSEVIEALTKVGDKTETDEDDKMPSGALSMIYSSDIDINKIFDLFKELVVNTGNATMNNSTTNLSASMISKMQLTEFERMADCYLSAFIKAS